MFYHVQCNESMLEDEEYSRKEDFLRNLIFPLDWYFWFDLIDDFQPALLGQKH